MTNKNIELLLNSDYIEKTFGVYVPSIQEEVLAAFIQHK